jgi:hypothetical protein
MFQDFKPKSAIPPTPDQAAELPELPELPTDVSRETTVVESTEAVDAAAAAAVDAAAAVLEDRVPRTVTLELHHDWPALGAVDYVAQFFAWGHLPAHLRAVSAVFGGVAGYILTVVPRNPERTVGLRKLLEAKDAIVRAVVAG